jgi:hypothetical protein
VFNHVVRIWWNGTLVAWVHSCVWLKFHIDSVYIQLKIHRFRQTCTTITLAVLKQQSCNIKVTSLFRTFDMFGNRLTVGLFRGLWLASVSMFNVDSKHIRCATVAVLARWLYGSANFNFPAWINAPTVYRANMINSFTQNGHNFFLINLHVATVHWITSRTSQIRESVMWLPYIQSRWCRLSLTSMPPFPAFFFL